MNETLRKLRREIELRGGRVYLEPHLPDDLAELFLREILDCPECMAAASETAARRADRSH
jgi:hypothetical protein